MLLKVFQTAPFFQQGIKELGVLHDLERVLGICRVARHVLNCLQNRGRINVSWHSVLLHYIHLLHLITRNPFLDALDFVRKFSILVMNLWAVSELSGSRRRAHRSGGFVRVRRP